MVRKLAVLNFNIKITFRLTLVHGTFGDLGNLKVLNLIETVIKGFLIRNINHSLIIVDNKESSENSDSLFMCFKIPLTEKMTVLPM